MMASRIPQSSTDILKLAMWSGECHLFFKLSKCQQNYMKCCDTTKCRADCEELINNFRIKFI